jgi:hypothetical protein
MEEKIYCVKKHIVRFRELGTWLILKLFHHQLLWNLDPPTFEIQTCMLQSSVSVSGSAGRDLEVRVRRNFGLMHSFFLKLCSYVSFTTTVESE